MQKKFSVTANYVNIESKKINAAEIFIEDDKIRSIKIIGEKNKDLPMYKDKPYSYVSSRRRRSLWRKKRSLGIGTVFLLLVLYFLGFFGSDAAANKKANDAWTWLQRPEKSESNIDWLGRR